MDWLFNNWKYQILPTEEVKEEDDVNSRSSDIKPKKPTKNNHKLALPNKKFFTEEYNINYENGIISFYEFESIDSLRENKNMRAIIYIVKKNDHYKNMKGTIKKIIKKLYEINVSSSGDISKDAIISWMNIRGLIGSYSIDISYELKHEHVTFNKYCGNKRELLEYIDELNENLVMLDMYIRRNLQNEYPELFI